MRSRSVAKAESRFVRAQSKILRKRKVEDDLQGKKYKSHQTRLRWPLAVPSILTKFRHLISLVVCQKINFVYNIASINY